MQNKSLPKCPYCLSPYKTKADGENRLNLFKDGFADEVVQIICPRCQSPYYVKRQIKYVVTKHTNLPYQEDAIS